MTSGDDLLKSLKKIGCEGWENVDGDVFDWYFENTDLAKFFKEFCTRIDSGHLRVGEHTGKALTSESILALVSEDSLNKKIEQKESDIAFKKQFTILQKTKLHEMQNLYSRANASGTILESAVSSNSMEKYSLKQKVQQLRTNLGNRLQKLPSSQDNLLAALSRLCWFCDNAKKSANSNDGDKTMQDMATQDGLLKTFLEKEAAFLHLTDELAELKESPSHQNNPQTLLEEWQNEQLRLHKCFFITAKTFNRFRAIESALQLEIRLLQRLLNQKPAIQDYLKDIEQAYREIRSLELSFQDTVIRSDDACEQFATELLSSVLLTNLGIKLERLRSHRKSREKILQCLQAEQNRLSFLQTTSKLESIRNSQLLKVCWDVSIVLRKQEAFYQVWIRLLASFKEKQSPPENPVISADDQVMVTLAEVLGSDKEEFIPSFNSVTAGALSVKSKMESDLSTNEKMLDTVCGKLEQLRVISELLNYIQEPLNFSTTLHGNLHLVGAMHNLETTLKAFASSVKCVQGDFQKFRQVLQECDREIFERKQKVTSAHKKVSRE